MKAASNMLAAARTSAGMRHVHYLDSTVALCGYEGPMLLAIVDRIPDYPQPFDSGWCAVCLKLAKLALFGLISNE
jgi:hypothetical protein